MIMILLSCAVYAVINIVIPVVIGNTVDGIQSIEADVLAKQLLTLLSLYILLYVADILINIFSAKLSSKIARKLRTKLFKKVHELKLQTIDQTGIGNILNYFSVDVDNVARGILQVLPKAVSGIVTVIGAFFIMLRINGIMTAVLVISAPCMYFLSRFVTKKTNNLFQKRADEISNLNTYAEEIITGQKTIKDFQYEEIAKNNFQKQNEQLYNVGLKAQFYSSLSNPASRFITNLIYVAVGIVGTILAGLGQISIGNISTFLMYANVYTKPFHEITSILSEIQISFASIKRIRNFLSLEEEKQQEITRDVKTFNGYIRFNNVTFSYTKEKPLIRNFNLEVEKGENVAIVGKTGAGKTTIANLLMRFYDLDDGEILIDGLDIAKIPKDILRKNIGMVLQDTKLFEGTIIENIAYGKENASLEEIEHVAKLAKADEFIRRLPQGYQTKIKEGMLSAGEIQLITIARILLLNPPIIILDEATSNVDLLTEQNIQQAFNDLMKNATSFVIAHRLSTIKNADKIIFIENGNIVEQGTHVELLQLRGKYYELYNSQFTVAK